MSTHTAERSWSSLVDDILGGLEHLVDAQIRLAKTEVKEDLAQASVAAGITAGGGALAAIGVGFLLLGAVYALSLALPAWLAAVLVGAVVLLTGGILMSQGKKRLREVFPLDQSAKATKETLEWAKNQIK